ncbi:glutaredoxin family protein [Tenacibaculum ovolyticum]|uniref:glutaredoxin family protein n=1 Tax=Tenacibaculum ovolyticum TaxID=104270 RepID=UPI003BADA657
MKVVLYGKRGHAYSVAFKNYLKCTDVIFEYKDISIDEQASDHTKKLYGGVLKVPTLFVDDKVYLTPTTDEFNSIIKELY